MKAMKPITITIKWDNKKRVFRVIRPTGVGRKSLFVGDRVRFVAKGRPLIVFPHGSPFSKSRPDWILGSFGQRLARNARPESRRRKFLCAVIKGGKIRLGKGGNLPPIKPF
jgi:hypothetical protein